jgi:RNA-directed DNA polymerase
MKRFNHLTPIQLAEVLEQPWFKLRGIARSAERHYWTEDRQVGKKDRSLRKPKPLLKELQSRLHKRILRKLEPHPSAWLMRADGQRRAAESHGADRFHFQGDLTDFYPSVRPAHVMNALTRFGMPTESARVITGLTTTDDQLPQGAPSSSGIAEVVLREMDYRLAGFAAANGLHYSRYADDFTVSGDQVMGERLEMMIRTIVASCGWTLHPIKSGVAGPDDRHQMLGLVVNKGPNITREYYDAVRHRVRLAASGKIHLNTKQLRSLEGKVFHIRRWNPARAASLVTMLRTILPNDAS